MAFSEGLSLLSLSIVFLLGSLGSNPATHAPIQDRGKLGTWYWRSPGVNAPEDEDSQTPILEKVDNAYLPARHVATGTQSALMTFGRFKSVQVNVDPLGQNILGDAANEPSLAVDPTNRNHIVAGWRQFDNVTSNFRQAGNGYSLDAGATWHNQVVLTKGLFRSDPVLAADSQGTFFYNSLQQTFFTDVFRSSNAGLNWNFQGPATGGDKQWMTCDQTTGQGRGNLYESWSTAGNNYGGRQFSRSVNGGASWLDPINIPGSPVWGTLDVAPNGAVYLGGLSNGGFSFCRSSDAQFAQQTPTFDRVVSVNLGGAIVFGSSINPVGLLGQTWIATDKSKGPNAGNIYMLCSVGVDSANPCQVNFSRSKDGGLTWSSPITINTDPLNKGASHWFGTLAVAPNGRIDVCWYDNRANPLISNSAMFTSSSFDGGTKWTPNVQVTQYFNPNIGYPNQSKMGDYMGMVSDSLGANIVYSATFNGEEDIWFLRLPAGAQPGNATAISTYQGVYSGGALPDVWDPDGSVYTIRSENIRSLGSAAAAQTDFILPASGVSTLGIKLRANTSITTTGMIWLYNWRTQAYDLQKTFTWPGGGLTDLTINFTTAASPYVDANHNVRSLLRFIDPARQGSRPFTAQFDLIQLLFG